MLRIDGEQGRTIKNQSAIWRIKFKNYLSRIVRICFIVLLYFSTLTPAYAVILTYTNTPTSIGKDPFTIGVTIDGASAGTNYLRIDLYKEGSTNYFGETYNGSSWYKGSAGTLYFPLTIGEDKIATASVQGKVGEPTSGEYPGPGQYKLRVKRYTNSGNPASGDTQTPVSVDITLPAISPSPTPLPKSTPHPTPASSPSNFPTPRATPAVIRYSPRVTPRHVPRSSINVAQILGDTASSTASPFSSPSAAPKPGSIAAPVGIIMMIAGIGLSGVGGFLAYKQMVKKEA